MTRKRIVLIAATYEYQDVGLRQLVAPVQNAEVLAWVLKDPEIGDFSVRTLVNQPSHEVSQQIESFFLPTPSMPALWLRQAISSRSTGKADHHPRRSPTTQ